jgi:hypothetical protein
VKQSKANKKTERRNITLSLSHDLLYKAKLMAVKEDKSLSEFMKEALLDKILKTSGYEKAKKRQMKMLNMNLDLGTKGRIQVSREDLHDRK